MFINLNYSLSIILHIFVVCFLIFIFKIERKTNIFNDVININLKTLKTFKTKDTSKEKNSIDLNNEAIQIKTKGRHDPCVGIRAVPVAEAMMAITILDQLLEHESQIGKVK